MSRYLDVDVTNAVNAAKEAAAKRRLRNAAPELLEAAKASVAMCRYACSTESFCGQCEPLLVVIAKAEGGR